MNRKINKIKTIQFNKTMNKTFKTMNKKMNRKINKIKIIKFNKIMNKTFKTMII